MKMKCEINTCNIYLHIKDMLNHLLKLRISREKNLQKIYNKRKEEKMRGEDWNDY